MKLITYLSLFMINNAFSQVPHEFESNQLIQLEHFNENFLFLKNKTVNSYQNNVNIKFDYDNTLITKEIFNENIEIINNLKTIEPVPLINFFNTEQNIFASSINDVFNQMENKIKKTYGNSCLDLLTNNHTLLNQDGFYNVVDNNGEFYQVYCDMTTAGGGWTLLFSPDSTTAYNVNSAKTIAETTLKGNDVRVISKTVFGLSTTLSEQQKAVKNVRFSQLNLYGYGITSSVKSSFSEKYTNLTSWDYNTTISGLTKCTASSTVNKWNALNNGQHTHTQAILGCYTGAAPYNDQNTVGLGVYSAKNSAYSCGRDGGGQESGSTASQLFHCTRWYLLGQSFHRGGFIFSSTTDKKHMVWGR